MKTEVMFTAIENRDQTYAITLDAKLFSSFTQNEIYFGTDPLFNQVIVKYFPSLTQASHEMVGHQTAAEAKIFVPHLIGLFEDSQGKIGLITQKIDGENLYTNRNPGLKFSLGNNLHQLHTQAPINQLENDRRDFSFYDFKLSRWRQSNRLPTANQALDLISQFTLPSADSNQYSPPTFLHHDLHDDQVIVTADSEVYLIDFEAWIINNHMDDLAIYLYHSLRTKRPESDYKEFLSGYFQTQSMSEQEKLTLSFYLLYTGLAMVDHYLEFRPRETAYALQYLQRSIDFLKGERLWIMT